MFDCFDYAKDIGQICNEVPFSMTTAGDYTFLTVANDRNYHVYSAKELKLNFEGVNHAERITHITADSNRVFTSTEKYLRSTIRSTNEYQEIELDEPVEVLVACQGLLLAASGNELTAYKPISLDEMLTIDCEKHITAVCHPKAALNKVVVAYDDGSFDLWNINRQQLIYHFEGFESPIIQIIQSPDKDTLGYATMDGRLIFHNYVYDKMLFSFQHTDLVTGYSFRTDGLAHVAVGLANGDLLVWDLNTHQILAKYAHAHDGQITSVHFLPGTNLLITGGSDNAIRQWILDPDCADFVRLFRARLGHSVPPTAAAFADVAGTVQLFTASGNGRVITMNPFLETSAQILSTSQLNQNQLKFPIVGMAVTNSHRFASAATIHENSALIMLWDAENKRFTGRCLTAMPEHGVNIDNDQALSFNKLTAPNKASCVCLTRCGNFAIVGGEKGNIEVFITQSARHRATAQRPHESKVVFAHVDPINTRIVTGSEDGLLLWHAFDGAAYVGEMYLSGPVRCFAAHPNGELIAVGHGNNEITLIDTAAKKIARKFTADASNMSFSHDGRFLFVGAHSNAVHLFDIITATLIQSSASDSPVTAFAVHPNGELIATLHAGKVATRLWKFCPQRITRAEGVEAVTESAHANLAKYSDQPLDKMKRLVNPPRDPLRMAKAPKHIPFFLQALADENGEDNEEVNEEIKSDRPQTKFIRHLCEDAEKGDFSRVMSEVVAMDNDSIQSEVAALGVWEGVDERLLFAKMLLWAVSTRKDFEMVQAILAVFLKEHAYTTAESKEVREVLKQLLEAQIAAVKFLEDDQPHALCLSQTLNRA